MLREGHRLVGVSNSSPRWKAGCSFVSPLYFLLSVVVLTYHSKCSGKTTDGQDFEAFIGAEKAEEMKQLFSNWIHTIYRKLSYTVWRCRYLSVHRSSCVRLAPLQQC